MKILNDESTVLQIWMSSTKKSLIAPLSPKYFDGGSL
jgi:hypothetical protein